MNSFKDIYNQIQEKKFSQKFSFQEVEQVLAKDNLSWTDFLVLLSSAAEPYLEPMAQKAHQITLQRFGKTIQLFAPIYISNECTNSCAYCGFNYTEKILRKTLSLKEFEQEIKYLTKQGFQNILLVASENRKILTQKYLEDILKIALKYSSQISWEIMPLQLEEYQHLRKLGSSGVVIYQETYHRETYDKVHRAGNKKDFYFRLNIPDVIGQAGYRNLTIGALLGLYDWRREAAYVGLHAQYLMKKYWQTKISVSPVRLRFVPSSFKIFHPVSDKNIVQFILAMRLFLHDAGITLSTREPADLREKLIPLGITQMSAGSKTSPGGYSLKQSGEQFKIADERSAKEIAQMLDKQGYEPVWKDWEEAFNQ